MGKKGGSSISTVYALKYGNLCFYLIEKENKILSDFMTVTASR